MCSTNGTLITPYANVKTKTKQQQNEGRNNTSTTFKQHIWLCKIEFGTSERNINEPNEAFENKV